MFNIQKIKEMKKTYNSPTTNVVVIKTQSILNASVTYNKTSAKEMSSGTFGSRRGTFWDDDDCEE